MSVKEATGEDASPDAPVAAAGPAKGESRTDMVGKALGLLVLLGEEPRGASAAELSRRADLPFSTTYRLLGSLTRDGFVDYEPDGRRYHLGLRIFQLGQRVSNHHGFAGTALPRKLARAAFFGVPAGATVPGAADGMVWLMVFLQGDDVVAG